MGLGVAGPNGGETGGDDMGEDDQQLSIYIVYHSLL